VRIVLVETNDGVRYRGDAMTGKMPVSAGNESLGKAILDCAHAAAILAVEPRALAEWSQQLGFPRDVGSGGSICFTRTDIEALQRALPAAHSVIGAIARVRTTIPD
jgi:hypothetical protein